MTYIKSQKSWWDVEERRELWGGNENALYLNFSSGYTSKDIYQNSSRSIYLKLAQFYSTYITVSK